MKVRELQEKLEKLNPDMPVFCYYPDDEEEGLFDGNGLPVALLAIDDVIATDARFVLLPNNVMWPEFGRGPRSRGYALLEVDPL